MQKPNWKHIGAVLAAAAVVTLQYLDVIIEGVVKAAEKGLTIGALAGIWYTVSRAKRRKEFEKRDKRWEMKLDAIGEAVKWNLPQDGSSDTDLMKLKQSLESLQEDIRSENHIRRNKMKNYLKKLGSRKFQAYLVTTILNIGTLVGMWTGNVNIEGQLQEWMPAINLVIQLLATGVYTWVEGKTDAARSQEGVTHIEESNNPVTSEK